VPGRGDADREGDTTMTRKRGGRAEDPDPRVRLALLLRSWWENAEGSPGGTRPTQQALAARLGIDQTTLSRYLNPRHTSTAPPRVVEALHAHLHAPAEDLARARLLCRAALEDAGRHSRRGGRTAPVRKPAGGPPSQDAPTAAPPPPAGSPARPALRFRLVLAAALVAVVLAFAGGAVAGKRFATGQATAPAAGRTTAPDAGEHGAPASPLLAYDWPLLKKRDEDQFARGRALQLLLRQHGYPLRADGIFGNRTRDAVMAFQLRHHLPVDGKVGRDTWPRLVIEVGPGDKGPAVQALQDLLHHTEPGRTEVTGEFTTATMKDLRFFQCRHGLETTGRADRATWKALLVFQRPPVDTPSYQKSERSAAAASHS